MEAYLNACRVLIKNFGALAQGLSARIKAAAYAAAEQARRPFRYLPHSQIRRKTSPASPAPTAFVVEQLTKLAA